MVVDHAVVNLDPESSSARVATCLPLSRRARGVIATADSGAVHERGARRPAGDRARDIRVGHGGPDGPGRGYTMRVTVGTVVGMLAAGHSIEKVLELYPYLEKEDVLAALSYAAWRAEEVEVPLKAS